MISSVSFNLGNCQFTISVNHMYHLDKNLKDCYQFDFDWSLLPDSLRKVSLLLLPFAPFFDYKYWMFLKLKLGHFSFQTCSLFAKPQPNTKNFFFAKIITLISWSNVAQKIFDLVKSSIFYAPSKYVKMRPFWFATEFNGAWVEGRMWRKIENTVIL